MCLAGTVAGLRDEIKMSTKALIEAKTSTVSVSSGCELFVRFITLTSKLEEKVRAKLHVHAHTCVCCMYMHIRTCTCCMYVHVCVI